MLDFAHVIVAAFEVDVFDCYRLVGWEVEGFVDCAERAAWVLLVEVCRIGWFEWVWLLTPQLLEHLILVGGHCGRVLLWWCLVDSRIGVTGSHTRDVPMAVLID